MLAVLAALLLSAPSTPAQHQRAATALYQVMMNYNAYGLFVGVPDEEGKTPMTEDADGTLTIGSAFAVSRDGWLMTARHVVDPAGGLGDLCARLSKEWPGSVSLRRVIMTTLIQDIAGHNYGVVASLLPVNVGDNLCMPGVAFEVSYDETTTARIRAMDAVADLAVVSIDADPILHLELARRRPDRWSEMFAIGYTDPGVRTVQRGSVAVRCELTPGVCTVQADGMQTCPTVLVMRTTAAVLEGMSGGAQLVGGNVVGVTTMRAIDKPIGFAIPSPYALAWYRHVRWPQKHKRPTTVCEPTPEQ